MVAPDRVGLGTAPLGGLYAELDDATAVATVDRAWELGLRFFDTAPLYGSGLAERRLGAALRGRPRSEFTVSTKVGRLLVPGEAAAVFRGAPSLAPVYDFTRDGVLRSLDESRERLGLDRVDVALIHDPEPQLEAALDVVDAVREAVPAVGVGTNVVRTALTFVREAPIDYVLIAGRYSLLDRSAAVELLPLAHERGVKVLVGGVYNSGILAGGRTYDYLPAPQEIVDRAARLRAVCARHDVPLEAAAIQFALRDPHVARIVVGARSPAEVEANDSLLAVPVPDELWAELALVEI